MLRKQELTGQNENKRRYTTLLSVKNYYPHDILHIPVCYYYNLV